MTEATVPAPAAGSDDYVTVATFFDPIEATVLCGALRAVHLDAVVGDGQTVQTDTLLAIAVKVRVRVPASQVAAAREAMSAIRSGALALEGEDAVVAPPPPAPQPAPLFSPDVAALWSLLLTPLFGTALMAANAWRDPAAVRRPVAYAWFAVCCAAVLGLVVYLNSSARDNALFVARLWLLALTATWYFGCAQPLSKSLIRRYGTGYARRSATWFGLAALAVGVGLRSL
jgi:hypothetical protein